MKRILVILLLFAGSAAASDWVAPIELQAGVGVSLPHSPDNFSDNFKKDLDFMIGFGSRALPFGDVIGKYEYHGFPGDRSNVSGGAITAHLLGLDIKAVARIPKARIEPFVLFGAGLSWVRQGGWRPAQPALTLQAQTDWFFNLGVGAQTAVTPTLGLLAQARWVRIQMSPTNSDVFDALQFWSLMVGVRVSEAM